MEPLQMGELFPWPRVTEHQPMLLHRRAGRLYIVARPYWAYLCEYTPPTLLIHLPRFVTAQGSVVFGPSPLDQEAGVIIQCVSFIVWHRAMFAMTYWSIEE